MGSTRMRPAFGHYLVPSRRQKTREFANAMASPAGPTWSSPAMNGRRFPLSYKLAQSGNARLQL